MYDSKNATRKYSSTQVTTIDRGRLLLMMYDGAINFLKRSHQGLVAGDIATFARFLSKAQAVIGELINTLDFEKGGNIAVELERLYDFMLFHLTEANLKKDPGKIQQVINLLETVASGFREIIERGDLDFEEIDRNAGRRPQSTRRAPSRTTSSEEKEESRGSTLRVSL